MFVECYILLFIYKYTILSTMRILPTDEKTTFSEPVFSYINECKCKILCYAYEQTNEHTYKHRYLNISNRGRRIYTKEYKLIAAKCLCAKHLTALHRFCLLISKMTLKSNYYFSSLQMRKPEYQEVKCLAQTHRAKMQHR